MIGISEYFEGTFFSFNFCLIALFCTFEMLKAFHKFWIQMSNVEVNFGKWILKTFFPAISFQKRTLREKFPWKLPNFTKFEKIRKFPPVR